LLQTARQFDMVILPQLLLLQKTLVNIEGLGRQLYPELEAITIIDLLRRAGIEVISAGLDAETITASRGVKIIPDTDLESALKDDYDMIVLPGGLPGADHLENDKRLTSAIKKMANNGQIYCRYLCCAQGFG